MIFILKICSFFAVYTYTIVILFLILGLDSAKAAEAAPRKRRENYNVKAPQLEVIRQQVGREGEVNLAFESGK